MSSDGLTTYQRYEAVVKNNSGSATGLRPVRVKCKFKAGEVPNDKCIVVTDIDGQVYPCQWAGEPDFNPRRGRTLSYWGMILFVAVNCLSWIILPPDKLKSTSSKHSRQSRQHHR